MINAHSRDNNKLFLCFVHLHANFTNPCFTFYSYFLFLLYCKILILQYTSLVNILVRTIYHRICKYQ